MRRYDSHPPSKVKGRAAALVSALFLTTGLPALGAGCPVSGDAVAEVAEVLDGATLLMGDGTTIRLAGIEAPPRPLELAADAPWPSGAAARAGLETLADGVGVRLAYAADTPDRYGRRHAHAFLPDGRSVETVLLAAGLARARWEPDEAGCFAIFLAAESGARKARLGLWADSEYAIRQANEPSLPARNGLYDLVEGRVVAVGHGSRMIFLDFGRNIRHDFTVMVPLPVAEALARAGRPVDTLTGRKVRVRGIIEESGGPAIRLNDPAEIELVDVGQNDAGVER